MIHTPADLAEVRQQGAQVLSQLSQENRPAA